MTTAKTATSKISKKKTATKTDGGGRNAVASLFIFEKDQKEEEEVEKPIEKRAGRSRAARNIDKTRSLSVPASPKEATENVLP